MWVILAWMNSSCYEILKKELKNTYRYYYEMGDDQYRDDYKKLFYAIVNYENAVCFRLNDLKHYEQIYRECISDNPLLFFVDNVTFSIGPLGVKINILYKNECDEALEYYRDIFNIISDIKKQCKNLCEKRKLLLIHDYVVSNVTYENNSELPVHSAVDLYLKLTRDLR